MYPPVVWTMPLGLPVVPLVYSMNSMSSLSICSGSQVSGWSATRSCHQTSRPSTMGTSWAVRFTTTTFSTGVSPSMDASALCFSGMMPPRRHPPSAVIITLDCESSIRSRSDSALNPPNTMLWGAPIRAHASMAMASSGTMGMYSVTRSPFFTPRLFNPLANLHTSRYRSR